MIPLVSSLGWRARKALSSGVRASAVWTCRRQGRTRSTVATARPLETLSTLLKDAPLALSDGPPVSHVLEQRQGFDVRQPRPPPEERQLDQAREPRRRA